MITIELKFLNTYGGNVLKVVRMKGSINLRRSVSAKNNDKAFLPEVGIISAYLMLLLSIYRQTAVSYAY